MFDKSPIIVHPHGRSKQGARHHSFEQLESTEKSSSSSRSSPSSVFHNTCQWDVEVPPKVMRQKSVRPQARRSSIAGTYVDRSTHRRMHKEGKSSSRSAHQRSSIEISASSHTGNRSLRGRRSSTVHQDISFPVNSPVNRRRSVGASDVPVAPTHRIRKNEDSSISARSPHKDSSPNSSRHVPARRRSSLGQLLKETSSVHRRTIDGQSTGWTVTSGESGFSGTEKSLFSETGWSSVDEESSSSVRKPRRGRRMSNYF
jgi:hypothetical protein